MALWRVPVAATAAVDFSEPATSPHWTTCLPEGVSEPPGNGTIGREWILPTLGSLKTGQPRMRGCYSPCPDGTKWAGVSYQHLPGLTTAAVGCVLLPDRLVCVMPAGPGENASESPGSTERAVHFTAQEELPGAPGELVLQHF